MLRSAVTGNTTAFRAKSLLLHLERTRGAAEADAFLQLAQLDRDHLEDETRPLANERWRAVLQVFAARYGVLELLRIGQAVVHPANLGVWTAVLRAAVDPGSAYERLDQCGGDEATTDVWQTVSCEQRRWRGRVIFAEDDPDELVASARAAELAAVPMLFGLRPAQVSRCRPEADGAGGLVQEFCAEWREPGPPLLPLLYWSAAVCAWLGLIASSFIEFAAISAAWLVLCLGGGALLRLAGRRRAAVRAQRMRLLALERSATLRERRERGEPVFGNGSVIAGHYRLTQHLGAGASGTIWEALRLSDSHPVAIKMLRAGMAHDARAADRLRREAAALGLAWHPNVVEVIEDGNLPDGTIYLVMERLRGETLAARLARQRPLAMAELLPIALQVCDALGAVHAAGIVHRDLKPSNVYLHRAAPGGPETVKLLDFGIAHVEWAETRITSVGSPLGTPGYRSPEQQRGLDVDARSDLYALGKVLQECLSSEPARAHRAGLGATPKGEPRSGVQRALTGVPAGWRLVIAKATAASPDQRYTDARSMHAALAALAEPSARTSSA